MVNLVYCESDSGEVDDSQSHNVDKLQTYSEALY